VLEATVTVIVDEPPAVTELGLKLTVVPVGWPLALRLTVCAEPLVFAVVIVDLPFPPWPMLRLVGLAPIEKSEGTGGVTVKPTFVEWVVEPVPVTLFV